MNRWSWIAVFAIACGDPSATPLEDSGVDGGSTLDGAADADAQLPDAPVTGPITIRAIRSSGEPAADAHVIVMDAHGTTLSITQTDSAGEATAIVPQDAMVTMLQGEKLITIVGVQPGDTLITGPTFKARPHLGSMRPTITPPTPPPIAGTDSYLASSRCNDTPSSSFLLDDRCVSGTFDAYVTVSGPSTNSNYGALRWTSTSNVTPVVNGTVTMPSTWSDPTPITTTLLTPTPLTGTTQFIKQLVDGGTILRDHRFGSTTQGGWTSTAKLLPVPTSTLQLDLRAIKTGISEQQIFARMPYTTQLSFDLASSPVPWLEVSETSAGRTVTWTPSAATLVPDVVVISVDSTNADWTVIGPARIAASGTFVFPALPPELDFRDIDDLRFARVRYIDLEGQTWNDVRGGLLSWMSVLDTSNNVEWRVAPTALSRVWFSYDAAIL